MSIFNMEPIDFANMLLDMSGYDIIERIEPCDEEGCHPLDCAIVARLEDEYLYNLNPYYNEEN